MRSLTRHDDGVGCASEIAATGRGATWVDSTFGDCCRRGPDAVRPSFSSRGRTLRTPSKVAEHDAVERDDRD